MRSAMLLALALALSCDRRGVAAPGPAANTVETRRANAPDQKPAFPGQTRAPRAASGVELEVTTLVRGLAFPWGLAFLPDGALLVTERDGRLRRVEGGALSPAIEGVPAVDARGQGGLFDVLLSPGFAQDRALYLAYAERRQGGNGTAVARARLSDDGARLEGLRVIWRVTPTLDSTLHFGGRMIFGRDGKLYVTSGVR
jgi:glucose/arabinose dehydrogenase